MLTERAVLFFVLLLIKIVKPHEEGLHTIQYTSEDFDDAIAKKHHFVMFYAPW